MEFRHSENQSLIASSAADFLTEISDSEAVRSAMESEQGFHPETWRAVTLDMGWQLTHIPEAQGGLGLGFVELATLLETMGRHLLCAPFFSTVCLGANALLVAGREEQQRQHLGLIAGEGRRYALAYASRGRHWGSASVTAEWVQEADEFVINGHYEPVVDGHTADTLILAARQPGTHGAEGLALFVVDADHPGIHRQFRPGMDQTRKQAVVRCTDLRLSPAAVMCDPGEAGPLLETILSLAGVCMAAEQLGIAERTLTLAVEHIRERHQFGRPVGSFQALKHKAADMMVRAESARSAAYYAACIADEWFSGGDLGSELHEAASIARACCADAAFENAAEALQLHGGAGFTWEYDIHLYLKRAKVSQHLLGDAAWHRERIARQLLDLPL